LPGAQDTIDQHLATIVGRDLDGFLATIHPDITIIVPNGNVMRGADAVLEFHREWFADGDWTYETERVDAITTPSTATRIVEVTYRDAPSEPATRFVMGLTFVREDDRWLLIHDQCTRLPAGS